MPLLQLFAKNDGCCPGIIDLWHDWKHILTIAFLFILGSFVIQRQRPPEPLAYIHSKPVNYTNNGGGRDTYISDSAGGLKQIYQPAYQKRTFYNNLRHYP